MTSSNRRWWMAESELGHQQLRTLTKIKAIRCDAWSEGGLALPKHGTSQPTLPIFLTVDMQSYRTCFSPLGHLCFLLTLLLANAHLFLSRRPISTRLHAGSGPSPVSPGHLAIIVDGNGRWAERRNLSRSEGHRAGDLPLLFNRESAFQVLSGPSTSRSMFSMRRKSIR